jgi:hypothetical protein
MILRHRRCGGGAIGRSGTVYLWWRRHRNSMYCTHLIGLKSNCFARPLLPDRLHGTTCLVLLVINVIKSRFPEVVVVVVHARRRIMAWLFTLKSRDMDWCPHSEAGQGKQKAREACTYWSVEMFLFHRGWPADPRTTPAPWQRLHCICKRSIGMTLCSASFWSCSSFLAGVRTPVWTVEPLVLVHAGSRGERQSSPWVSVHVGQYLSASRYVWFLLHYEAATFCYPYSPTITEWFF